MQESQVDIRWVIIPVNYLMMDPSRHYGQMASVSESLVENDEHSLSVRHICNPNLRFEVLSGN